MSDSKLRERICACGASLFGRGLNFGSTGNLSVRHPDGGWLMTPTNASLGELDPARLSRLDDDGRLVEGDPPTKEAFLHRVMYAERAGAAAVVHLHSTHSVAVSCLHGLDPCDCLPPLTAYYVMRVGRLPLVPYHPPGDENLARAVRSSPARIMPCCSPITAPWWRARRSRTPSTRRRSSRRPRSSDPHAARARHAPAHARAGRGPAGASEPSVTPPKPRASRLWEVATCDPGQREPVKRNRCSSNAVGFSSGIQ